MKRTTALLAAVVFFGACSAVFALYVVSNEGTWPKSWPRELEPLRKQAHTLVGPEREDRHYAIPFTKREEFESAWPHLLKVKTKGAQLILVCAPNFFLGGENAAGVIVHCPPLGQAENPDTPEAPSRGLTDTTYIELVVDGKVVDLNRIPLPPDTPIVDKRFEERSKK